MAVWEYRGQRIPGPDPKRIDPGCFDFLKSHILLVSSAGYPNQYRLSGWTYSTSSGYLIQACTHCYVTLDPTNYPPWKFVDAGHGYVNCLKNFNFESKRHRADLFSVFLKEVVVSDFTE